MSGVFPNHSSSNVINGSLAAINSNNNNNSSNNNNSNNGGGGGVGSKLVLELSKYVRPVFLPPPGLGVPVTPLTAAKGLLVTRGPHWGCGLAYDDFGREGVVGYLEEPVF
eukprot:CAMPEP_0175072566 /NCGR_PEP_ID=MMETSP0052_2-20121109/19995_1 /TAXON_ID=51329 ORGANISM="Polytomella parva, Strain SAG 63-3" /NCGR_SAMPLE_ID=MMETSP0052_2 /ASSEMBLY_ACC=CAM_ASM_000194 /LENGTH=109 /DNA_ID=CAMNT_0016340113 /DNA_START=1 /DNA_END=327 /DNA_ORIENTATION=-